MKRIGSLVAVLAFVLLTFGGALAADGVTLEGKFVWQRDDGDHDGDVRAVFTETAKGEWNVSFHFEWEDGPHVYAGTATGSLTGGKLHGVVKNDSEDREATFRFTGRVEDGKFSGTHGRVQEDGSLRDTGTISLGQPAR